MATDPNPLHTKRDAGSQHAGEFLGVGLQFAGSILIFLFAGRWLDERLGTAPWLLLLGVFVGFGLGFLFLYRKLITSTGSGKREERR